MEIQTQINEHDSKNQNTIENVTKYLNEHFKSLEQMEQQIEELCSRFAIENKLNFDSDESTLMFWSMGYNWVTEERI